MHLKLMCMSMCMHACLVTQLCPALCDALDCSLPGSSVHRILQARILEWVAMPISRESSQPRDQTCMSYGSNIAAGFFTAEPPGKSPTFSYPPSQTPDS